MPSNMASGHRSEFDLNVILTLFKYFIGRNPTETEVAYGLGRLSTGRDWRDYVLELAATPEAQQSLTVRGEAPLFVPPGHYYSPIVNVAELSASRAAQVSNSEVLDVEADMARQFALFRRLSAYFGRIPFPVTQTGAFRYYFENDFYSYGDALVLSAIIQEFRPKRVIEVGCGFSSAVILDTLEHMPESLANTKCVFVDPFPERLKVLLMPSDYDRVTIIEEPVQHVDLALFCELEKNDILFLDTSHVIKTGSDVNHELFEILPRLKPGVLIHFHDVFDRFEYPDAWIVHENRSWNELYALRAFLMNNSKYQILLMSAAVARNYPDEARRISAAFMKNPGGSLWLRKGVSAQFDRQ